MKWLFWTILPVLLVSTAFQLRLHIKSAYLESISSIFIQTDIFNIRDMRPFDVPISTEPTAPYPIVSPKYCDIVCGFGRGSSELGIPTANVEISDLSMEVNKLELGVYFGFAHLKAVTNEDIVVVQRKDGRDVEYNYGRYLDASKGDLDVIPVVLSIGKNPFYGNEYKTVELHLLHNFSNNFYGAKLKFNILGYIRPELDYTTAEALINDINIDIDIAKRVLATPEYSVYKEQVSD